MKKRERKKRKKNFFEKEIYAAIRYVEHEERRRPARDVWGDQKMNEPEGHSEDGSLHET